MYKLMSIKLLLILMSSVFSGEYKKLNSDTMLRGYCYVESVPHPSDLGGFAKSDNYPKSYPSFYKEGSDTLELRAFPNEFSVFDQQYKGFKLLLVNTATKSQFFHASDSRLPIVMQAKTNNGQWQDIEYLPQSFCGNSYHTVKLPPKSAWLFSVPHYTGNLKVTLRFKMKTLYSNEFNGYINQGQLKRNENQY